MRGRARAARVRAKAATVEHNSCCAEGKRLAGTSNASGQAAEVGGFNTDVRTEAVTAEHATLSIARARTEAAMEEHRAYYEQRLQWHNIAYSNVRAQRLSGSAQRLRAEHEGCGGNAATAKHSVSGKELRHSGAWHSDWGSSNRAQGLERGRQLH